MVFAFFEGLLFCFSEQKFVFFILFGDPVAFAFEGLDLLAGLCAAAGLFEVFGVEGWDGWELFTAEVGGGIDHDVPEVLDDDLAGLWVEICFGVGCIVSA